MENLNDLKKLSGMYNQPLNESKYGTKFDQFKLPFKVDGDTIKDNTGKEICECPNATIAKELMNILNDIRKMREISERLMSLGK